MRCRTIRTPFLATHRFVSSAIGETEQPYLLSSHCLCRAANWCTWQLQKCLRDVTRYNLKDLATSPGFVPAPLCGRTAGGRTLGRAAARHFVESHQQSCVRTPCRSVNNGVEYGHTYEDTANGMSGVDLKELRVIHKLWMVSG